MHDFAGADIDHSFDRDACHSHVIGRAAIILGAWYFLHTVLIRCSRHGVTSIANALEFSVAESQRKLGGELLSMTHMAVIRTVLLRLFLKESREPE